MKTRLPSRPIRLLLLATLVVVSSAGEAPARGLGPHTEYWSTGTLDWSVSSRDRLRLENEFRFDQGLYYRHTDLSISRRRTPNLSLTAALRVLNYEKDTVPIDELRPHIGAVLSFNVGTLLVEDRNTFEYRLVLHNPLDTIRYRNRLSVFLPMQLAGRKAHLFAAYEPTLELSGDNAGQVVRERMYYGVGRQLFHRSWAELYLLHQARNIERDEGESWDRFDAAGFRIRVHY